MQTTTLTWLKEWKPETTEFWHSTGKAIAWKTLAITTFSLVLSFSTWFMMSAIVVMLPGIGFKFTTMQLFWLTAVPGIAGGFLRMLHTFLIPVYGTRHVVTFAALVKLIPCLGIGLAIMDPGTPFWVFLILSLLAGLGGGDFSSHMPSTSIFFPKKLQGTALGIQAGAGNFGVSLVQLLTPWTISFAALGALAGGPQVWSPAAGKVPQLVEGSYVWLQNAAYWPIPFLVLLSWMAWRQLKSIPIRTPLRQQLDIFRDKHTWYCTLTYLMTFGSFAGLSAALPLMIKSIYGHFPGAPNPLEYAFYGPLIGSVSRIVFGIVADKTGGAKLTHISGIALFIGTFALLFSGCLSPSSLAQFPLFLLIVYSLFFFTGIGNASTFRQFPIIFGHCPRQAAGVIGWSAAVAAFGPFIFSIFIGTSISANGSAHVFFVGLLYFYAIATFVNWWFYTRKGCERPS